MFFGPGSNSRIGSRLRKSNSKKHWNQAHLAVVAGTAAKHSRGRAGAQRLSPDLILGERPRLLVLEGGISLKETNFNLTQDSVDTKASFSRTHVEVEIKFDSDSDLYFVTLTSGGFVLETRSGRRSNHILLTRGFESIDGEKVRIPWKQILNGLVWNKTVEMRDWYFEELCEKERLSFLLKMNAERLAP